MELAIVTGTVVATRKDAKLSGGKFLLVRKCDQSGNMTGREYVALDSVDAGKDELVLIVSGSSARVASGFDGAPVDAVIIGVVDTVESEGRVTYKKG